MRIKSLALVLTLALAGLAGFSGDRAEAATVSRVVIDFDETVGDRFALDNIIGDNTNISFDELATAPVDGLSVDGVTFGFQQGGLPSADAVFAAFDLTPIGPMTFLDGNILEGSALGILTLDFAVPTSFLSFGFALNGDAPLPVPGAVVSLFDAADRLIGSFTVDVFATQTAIGFPEGLFEYSIAAVPVPAALPLFVIALAGLGLARRRSARN